jgi:hypothetical protein
MNSVSFINFKTKTSFLFWRDWFKKITNGVKKLTWGREFGITSTIRRKDIKM